MACSGRAHHSSEIDVAFDRTQTGARHYKNTVGRQVNLIPHSFEPLADHRSCNNTTAVASAGVVAEDLDESVRSFCITSSCRSRNVPESFSLPWDPGESLRSSRKLR
jgi:hypothetical protein